MPSKIKKIEVSKLTGPRSYFTDLDPNDLDYNEDSIVRRLKLQLLTKKNIVIAASSLFHDVGMQLFSKHKGLCQSLNQGIIIPAIRDQFESIDDFFEAKAEYSSDAKIFFNEHVSSSVPWNLYDNSGWFKKSIYNALSDEKSILRQHSRLEKIDAATLIINLDNILNALPESDRFLSREIIKAATHNYSNEIYQYIDNYSTLVYRLSGARVVNAEGHFPQSNLSRANLVGNDKILNDEAIFWDVFIEAAVNHMSKATILTVERLDRLDFEDILKIRKSFFEIGFVKKYDEIIALSKSDTTIEDPEALILKAQEISESANFLRQRINESFSQEINVVHTSDRENAFWQIANTIVPFSSPEVNMIIGTLSALKAIPEITAPLSNNLSASIFKRMEWFRRFVNTRIGWSKSQKIAFIDAYKALLSYDL